VGGHGAIKLARAYLYDESEKRRLLALLHVHCACMCTVGQMEARAAYREAGSVEPFGNGDDRGLGLEIQNAWFMPGLCGPVLAFFTGGLDRNTTSPPKGLESPEVSVLLWVITNRGRKRDSNGGFERGCDREVEDDEALFS
jgi:hypothetical protein